MASLLLATILISVSTAVLWFGASQLERASEALGEQVGIPPVVQGSIVLAIGSSFPELASVLVAALVHDAFGLGLGVVVGSAVFNILVIPAASVLASDAMPTDRDLVYKEGLSYLVAVLGLVVLLALAVVYNPVAGLDLDGVLTRPMVLLPLGLYGLYVLLQWADTRAVEPTADGADGWRTAGRLIAGLALVLASAEGLVRGVLWLGDAWGLSPFLWGVTVVAVATSLPDALASITAARRKRTQASLGNALGSNTFDLLVVIPLGVLAAGATVVDLGSSAPLLLGLALATLLLIAFMRTGFILTRREAATLLAAYGAFLGVALGTTLGIPLA